MNEIKISVIIPIYNSEKFLRQCLDSVLNQTLQDIEVICVNDGSIDKSSSILEEYAEMDKRIKVIDQKNQGLSEARNSGLKIARGRYISFLDSDDWIENDMYECMYHKGLENDLDVVMCTYVKEFRNHSTPVHIFPVCESMMPIENVVRRLIGPIGEELSRPQELDLLVSSCMQIIKRERAQSAEFIDTRRIGTEDLLYQVMVYSKCKTFMYLDIPFYHYRRSDMGTLTTSYMKDKYERWVNLFELLGNIISENDYGELYFEALQNRKALSMIGIGLNETFSPDGYIKKASHLKSILSSTEYSEAFSNLDFQYFPFHWHLFFLLCKHKCSFSLMLMLELIEILRKRKV